MLPASDIAQTLPVFPAIRARWAPSVQPSRSACAAAYHAVVRLVTGAIVISNRLSFRKLCQTSHAVSLAHRTSSHCVAVGMRVQRPNLAPTELVPLELQLHEINMNHHQCALGALCTVSEAGYDAAQTM